MAEPGNTGLEADIGVTLGKLNRQMAAAEARMIRAAKRGEAAFTRANPRIVKSFDQVDAASMRMGKGAGGASNGLRQMSMQLSQVGQQGAATGNYLQALAIQLPDLALGFGTVGILIGAAAGSLLTLAPALLGSSDAVDKLIDSLVGGERGLSSARSSIEELRNLQEQYTKAIEASAGASSGTASVVAANSKREFEARKQVLSVELQLLKIRGEEQQANLDLLRDQEKATAQAQIESNSSGIGQRFTPRDGRDYFNTGPRSSAELLGEGFIRDNRERQLSIRKLNAEIELTTLAIEESAAALNGEFADIGGGAAVTGATGGGSGGSSGRARELKKEIVEVDEAMKDLEATAQTASGHFSTFLTSIITDSDNAGQAIKKLADTLLNDLLGNALSPVSQAFGNLFSNVISGGFGGAGMTTGTPLSSSSPNLLPSFSGGGYTGAGARSGGVDGQGGFPAILHPNETVIDHSKKQSGGMTISQSFHINGSGLDAEQVAYRLAPLMEAKAAQVFARARREGR